MHLTDTHCHINFGHFDEDRNQIISRALESGIERILVPGVDLETSRSAIKLSEMHSGIYAAVGIHPNSGKNWSKSTLREIEEMASHPKVVAIGEIGLDYYRDNTPKETQKKIFFQQLELAMNLGLPVVVHNRESTEEMLGMLASWHRKLIEFDSGLVERPGVLHSYSGSLTEARKAIAMNFYLGISGPVTYKNSENLREVVAHVDLEKLLIETDSPYLTPQHFRGQRNEPSYVKYVVERMSEIMQPPEKDIAKKTSENAEKLFKWK